MAKIILTGWSEGLEKVGLSKLQIGLLKKSLKESKSNVDNLLDGKEVTIETDDLEVAKQFVDEARKIGVICEIKVR